MFKRAKEFLKATQMDLKEVEPPAPADPITGVLMDDLVYLRPVRRQRGFDHTKAQCLRP